MVLAAIISILFGVLGARDAAATGTITGRVTGPDGEPLAGVEVQAERIPLNAAVRGMFDSLWSTWTGFVASTLTTVDGSYRLDLKPSDLASMCIGQTQQYVLYFSPPAAFGFTPKRYRGPFGNEFGGFVVQEGQTIVAADVRLGPPASISGTITGADGLPLVGASVTAGYAATNPYEQPLWRTTTDGRGRYTLTNLQDDDYFVEVIPAGAPTTHVYYPGTDQPVPIRPQLGRNTPGYDMVFPALGSLFVGSVDYDSIIIYGFAGERRIPLYGGSARLAITVDGLPPGQYAVQRYTPPDYHRAEPSVTTWYPGAFQAEDAQPVTIRAGEVTTISLPYAPRGTLRGRVVDGAGSPIPNVEVVVDDLSSCPSSTRKSTSTDATGKFSLSAAGDKRVSFAKEGYVTSWLHGKADREAADVVRFRSSETVTLPDVVLESRGAPGSIAGLVLAGGAPSAGTRVEVWSAPAGTQALCAVTPAADGSYEVAGLTPGSYLVRFLDAATGSNLGEKWHPDAVSAATATPVVVEAGTATTGIDADLGLVGTVMGTTYLDPVTFFPSGPPGVCLADLAGQPVRCIRQFEAAESYRFDGVAPGSYLVAFDWEQDYTLGLWYPGEESRANALPVVVAPGQTVANIDVALPAHGWLEGSVTSSTGYASAYIYGVDADTGAVRWIGAKYDTPENPNPYSYWIYPGRYRFLFAHCGTYASQWYPGVPSAAEAAIVEVLPGQTVSGIDAVLEWWTYNHAPVLADPGAVAATEGAPTAFTLSADDENGDLLTFSAQNLPPGASFDPYAGAFSWTPSCTQAGTYPDIVFTVTDHGDPPRSDSKTVPVSVAGRDCAPVLDPIGDKSVIAGETLAFTVTASDPEGNPIVLEATNTPPGASFNAADGTFSWTPTTAQAGDHQVTFAAVYPSDTALRGEEVVTITVLARPAPVLDPLGPRSVIAGEFLTFQVAGSDPNGDAVLLEAANVPEGASFDPATGTFTWTPTTAQAGDNRVTFAAVYPGDTTLRDEETVSITVLGPLLFQDSFAHADLPADPDWVTAAGGWAVRDGALRSRLAGEAIALAGPANLAGDAFAAGRVRARVKLGPLAARTPNLKLVFAYRDPQHYRFVRLLPGATEIGQVGDIDGQPPLRVRRERGLAAGRWQNVRVDLQPDGLVRAFTGDTTLGALKFATPLPGAAGVATRDAQSFVDDFSLWSRAVLP